MTEQIIWKLSLQINRETKRVAFKVMPNKCIK